MAACWQASQTFGAEAKVRPATSVHNLKWQRKNSPTKKNKPTERTVATVDRTCPVCRANTGGGWVCGLSAIGRKQPCWPMHSSVPFRSVGSPKAVQLAGANQTLKIWVRPFTFGQTFSTKLGHLFLSNW